MPFFNYSKTFVQILFLLNCWTILFVIGHENKPHIKGLNLKEAKLLRYSSTEFTCKDGSKTIPFRQVNDDYCDCEDASDEPGTSACSNGHFWCENKKYKGKQIFSSRVGDGICDCCDGSDEPSGLCQDKCGELAQIEKQEFEKELEVHRLGVEMKQQYIYDAEIELAEKKQLLETKNQELEALKQKKQAAEEIKKENEEKEKVERERLEAEKKAEEEQKQQEKESQNNEGASIQEEQQQEAAPPLEREDDEGDKDEEEKMEEPSAPSAEQAAQDELNKLLQPFIEASQKARKEFDELDQKVRNLENEVRDLEKIFNLNLGPKKEFYYLYGKCFSADAIEYTYELCPFDKVNQKPKSGSSTSLGTWNNDAQTEEWTKDHKFMLYNNGQKCWGGPDRSAKIQLLCGSDNALTDPQEPNKCEYSFKFYTPAVCSEERLQELESKLESGKIFHDDLEIL